tara:strand:- start:5925 stop:6197 length:273 start_codon:yes stop_codon:yes gene_type:complete
MLLYEEPTTDAEAAIVLDDLCSEAEVIMYPATRGDRRGLNQKRRKVNALLDRLIASCFRKGWKDVADKAVSTRDKMIQMKEAVQELNSIF